MKKSKSRSGWAWRVSLSDEWIEIGLFHWESKTQHLQVFPFRLFIFLEKALFSYVGHTHLAASDQGRGGRGGGGRLGARGFHFHLISLFSGLTPCPQVGLVTLSLDPIST